MLIQVSENDPFLLDETETARCVEVCRAYLIEGAPSGTLAEELARSWINVVGETLQRRRRQKAAATSTRARRCSELCTCIPNTGNLFKAVPRLGECCRQVEAEEVSNSRNKIHQTWERPL